MIYIAERYMREIRRDEKKTRTNAWSELSRADAGDGSSNKGRLASCAKWTAIERSQAIRIRPPSFDSAPGCRRINPVLVWSSLCSSHRASFASPSSHCRHASSLSSELSSCSSESLVAAAVRKEMAAALDGVWPAREMTEEQSAINNRQGSVSVSGDCLNAPAGFRDDSIQRRRLSMLRCDELTCDFLSELDQPLDVRGRLFLLRRQFGSGRKRNRLAVHWQRSGSTARGKALGHEHRPHSGCTTFFVQPSLYFHSAPPSASYCPSLCPCPLPLRWLTN